MGGGCGRAAALTILKTKIWATILNPARIAKAVPSLHSADSSTSEKSGSGVTVNPLL